MRYSTMYLRLLNMQSHQRYSATFLSGGLILVAWFFFWYFPYEKSIEHLEQKIKQSKHDSEQLLEQQMMCKQLSEKTDRLLGDIQAAEAALLFDSNFISLLIQQTQHTGLDVLSIRSADLKEKGDYRRMHLDFEALGNFDAIAQFFVALVAKNIPIQCDQLSVSKKEANQFLLHCVLKRTMVKTAQGL